MKRTLPLIALSLVLSPSLHAEQPVQVTALASAPTIDGDLSEWSGNWVTVPISDAIENDKKNRTGNIDVEIQSGIQGDRIYFAVRWPDDKADVDYKPWVWKKTKYKRGKDREDMFALRFDMGGDFHTCMVSKQEYQVDVWLWSIARTDPQNYAADMWHRFSTERIENSAEYEADDGQVIYIKKSADDGKPGYDTLKVDKKKGFQGDELPSVDVSSAPKGSTADVSAKGVWKDGYWHLELSRKLDTGHSDDVAFNAGAAIKGQIAVFNKGYAEHKSVSDALLFQLP